MSDYVAGFIAGFDGDAPPPFPKPDTSWGDRLFARGWSDGVRARASYKQAEGGQ